jgi:hypothetical protein
MSKKLLEPSVLRKLLSANFETGELTWEKRDVSFFSDEASARRWNTKWAGKSAFTSRNMHGYAFGGVLGVKLQAHRVVWALRYGAWPNGQIDHINGVRDDNRIFNLRDVTASENQKNQGRSKRNTSGVSGVSWCSRSKKWRAYSADQYRITHLGYHNCIGVAVKARNQDRAQKGYSVMSGIRLAFPS